MASQASYKTNVSVADPELARRKTSASPEGADADSALSNDEVIERDEIEDIIDARERYAKDRQQRELEWVESFKMYMSWVDRAVNPFLSNLFIPKTHEAVELLAAFLIGTNQNITAAPENGAGDTLKARVSGKYLDFLWRKVLKARIKILVWIKQGILFGDGILKVGWDVEKGKPWLSVCALEDVYFDYFEADIQDSEYIIHEIRKSHDSVMSDPRYDIVDKEGKPIREQVIVGGESFDEKSKVLFSTFDGSLTKSECKGKVLVMEVWCAGENGSPQMLKTLLPTKLGWRVARRTENPNKWRTNNTQEGEQFRPFAKFRFKTSALPNRAYDISGVFPTIHIQKAFNDLMRQYFDSVQIINNPMGKKRRGARINPSELVRRPGGIVTMGDITKDFAWDNPPDVKASIIEMLNRLDREFQEASMVVNLLKGMSQADTATGDALAQQNVNKLLDMINQNVEDALSEVGQMVLAITLANKEGRASVVMYENENEVASLEFDVKSIDGIHDVRIVPDRTDNVTRAGQNAALVKVYPLIAQDGQLLTKYPSLKEKMIKRIMENDGVGDPDYFFAEDNPQQAAPQTQDGGGSSQKVSVSMSYKDAPDDVRREIEAGAGFTPSKTAGSQDMNVPTPPTPVLQ